MKAVQILSILAFAAFIFGVIYATHDPNRKAPNPYHQPASSYVNLPKVAEPPAPPEPKTTQRIYSEKEIERAALIEKLKLLGVFGDVDCRASGGDVVVRPAFYALDYKDKQSFVSVVYAYCFPSGKDFASINLVDAMNNHKVGDFLKETGLRMK